MRLIDADALIEALKENEWITNTDGGGLEDIINDSPTVESCYQTTSCLDCGNYDKENHNCPRYCEVIKEAINSRPQGEWKYIGSYANTHIMRYECSKCGRIVDVYKSQELLPVCHCGADMQGGKR